jgi:hypothetical protein
MLTAPDDIHGFNFTLTLPFTHVNEREVECK